MNRARIPGLKERIQALITDGLIIVVLMFLATVVFEKIGEVSDSTRMYLFLFLFFVYDPLFTTFGGTLGHRAMGLRVKRENQTEKNISLPAAIFRFALKSILGWISLISVSVNSKGKAIHDFASGSVVVYKKATEIFAEEATETNPNLKEDEEILDQN